MSTSLRNSEIIVSKWNYPFLAYSIHFGICKDVSERIMVRDDLNLVTIYIVIELITHSPFKGQNLEFICQIISITGSESSAGIYYCSLFSPWF